MLLMFLMYGYESRMSALGLKAVTQTGFCTTRFCRLTATSGRLLVQIDELPVEDVERAVIFNCSERPRQTRLDKVRFRLATEG